MDVKNKARILVIDDDPLSRSPLRVHSAQAGDAAQAAQDAAEGVKALLQPHLRHADIPKGGR